MASRSSTTRPASPRPLPETVIVGEVGRPHGLRGEVVVAVLTDVPDRFRPGSTLSARAPDGRRFPLTVEGGRPHRSGLVVGFEGVADREAAAALRGVALEVPREAVPPAPPGSYYHFELLGCRCVDREAGELGEVVEVLDDGGGQLLLVRGTAGETPVPFVERFLRRVDVEGGVIEVELPPGLVEICTSK